MTDSLQLSVDALIQMYQHLQDDNSVFWINSLHEIKPVFISPGFEKVWGYKPEVMYNNPEIWYDSLVPELRHSKSYQRYVDEIAKACQNTLSRVYTIVDAKGELRNISDTSFKLLDANGNEIAIAGIAKSVPESAVNSERTSEYRYDSVMDLKRQLLPLLEQQFKLNPPSEPQSDNHDYYVSNGDQQVRLTRREAQCLYYFFQGKSSKQIGRILDISHRTVELYFDRIREKLDCKTRLEIISKIEDRSYIDRWHFAQT